jgi:bifunctional oligoribonuclease and PAP phosphatase NrnA
MLEHVSSLLDRQRFVITTHIRPDGDALGSQLALGRFLEKLGREVSLINSDPAPYNLTWLPGIEGVEVFDGSLDQRARIDEADLIVVVDTNSAERLGKLTAPVRHSGAKKLLIDHHTRPESWFDEAYARETASSTGELVYEIIAARDPSLIDTEIATALYTAIMTDTGSFRYSSVTSHVHRIVADLLDYGDIQPAPIHISLYDTQSIEGLRLLARALEGVTIRYSGRLATMVISQRMVREANAGLDETEGFVNYALSVEGVEAAAIFLETDSGTKISFRSKGRTYVNEWARAFGGGGHRNAAGAYVRRPLDVVVEEVIAAAPRFMDLEEEEPEEEQALSPEDAAYLSTLLNMKARSNDR